MARAKQPQVPLEEDEFIPPFYEATEDIYLGDPESGVAPVRAFGKGDPVHPGIVDAHKLGGKVKVPDVFAGVLPEAPTPEVLTDPAQENRLDLMPDAGGKEGS